MNINDYSLRTGCLFTLLYMGFLNACLVPFPELMKDRLAFYSQRERFFYSSPVSCFFLLPALFYEQIRIIGRSAGAQRISLVVYTNQKLCEREELT